MKTDLIEIFQTVRASIQPFAAMGLRVDEHSENRYQLSAHESLLFAKLDLDVTEVRLCLLDSAIYSKYTNNFPKIVNLNADGCIAIKSLDDQLLNDIETSLAEGYKVYKQEGWV